MMDNSFEIMFAHSLDNWWFRGKRMEVEAFLDTMSNGEARPWILDVGCGTGEIMAHLPAYGNAVGVDFSLEALGYSHLRGAPNLIQGNGTQLPLKSSSFDIILLLDFLEHTRDDRQVLRDCYDVLTPGGHLLVTVPALPSLWSKRDRELHHFRRYRKRELTNRLRGAGFQIHRITYRNFLLFPWAYGRYKRERWTGNEPKMDIDLVLPPWWLNQLIVGILWLETAVLKVCNLPFGCSLICHARKS